MATIKVKWTVEELVNVMTLFDVQKVYRSTTGAAGAYSEITSAPTRVTLVAGTVDYFFDDTSGDTAYWYKVSYFHSSTLLESELSDPISGAGGGNYVTVQDMRDEGVLEADHDDARVIQTIRLAESYVERITQRWFYPKSLVIRMDQQVRSDVLLVGPPIIQLDDIRMLYEPVVGGYTFETVEVDSTRIYNRHLTQGLMDPDDREAPKVVFEDFDWQTIARWWKGNQNVVLTGWFGYTELGPTDTAGEVGDEGSQVPLSKGQTPPAIADAVKRLVVRWLPQKNNLDDVDDVARRWQITRLKTRDQEIQYGGVSGGGVGTMTGDPYIDSILGMYKRPVKMGFA